MNLPDPTTLPAHALRIQAQAQLASGSSCGLRPLAADELLQELQLHQIELEMQNQALRESQTALEAERARYLDLYELAPVGYCSVSATSLILQANLGMASLLGVERSGLLQQPLGHFMRQQEADYFYLLSKRLLASGGDHSCELPMLKNDGTPFWAQLACRAAQDQDGGAVLRIAMNDVTALKQAGERQAKQEAAEATNLAKSRFLAAASHDLRQPAHALGLFVARLAQLPHDAQSQPLVAGLDASVRALQDMLDALLDLSRLDSEPDGPRRQAFAIAAVFEQLRNGMDGMASAKGLRLRFRPSPLWLHSDPTLLHSILLNLVSNAIRFTHCGSVLVSCRADGASNQARLEVRDSGIGIAAQDQAHIFDEFYQVGNPERDRSQGLGLGLSLVQRSCRHLQHSLSLQSSPGRGTRFTVMVPLAPKLQQDAPPADEIASESTSLNGLQLLVIEDDPLGRAALSGLLSSWGCRVMTADAAPAACELITQGQRPDVIVSDYRLRGDRNGIELIQTLRALARQDVAACLISGDTDRQAQDQARTAGLVLLQKPVRPAKLRSLLRHLTRHVGAR